MCILSLGVSGMENRVLVTSLAWKLRNMELATALTQMLITRCRPQKEVQFIARHPTSSIMLENY